jgi:CHAT domain-containing protein
VQLIDLGPAERIEQAVAPYRQAIKAGASAINERGEAEDEVEFKKRLEAIARLVLRPLEPMLSRYGRWLISPDASLWLLPWGALPDEAGHYFIERHTISTLISGRDLVVRGPRRNADTTRGGLVLADPDFDLAALPRRDGAARALGRGSSLPVASDWPRLPGTADEAAAVLPRIAQVLGEQPRLVTGPEAIEAALKSAQHPRVMVAGTHGFFLKDQDLEALPGPNALGGGDAGLQGPISRSAPAEPGGTRPPVNPLLRCGLVLAGANARDHATDPRGDDGILTALEIVGADLHGTELVVLSACETARGEIHIGEGVAGLRQAFQLAGARTVVATLWQIPDAETVALMTRFWDNLAAGHDADASLRSAQLGLIQERRQAGQTAHPFFWAAFTLTGQTSFRKEPPVPGRTP